MRIFNKQNVFDAALDRIRYLFDEFPNIVVGFSGGKDSTITLNLALIVAKEKNRLPLKVLFIDQEAEWQGTMDLVKEVMHRPDVDPYWFQMPMVITNNASSYERYNHCWEVGKEENWIHPKDPLAKTENKYGTERFHELFEAIFKVEFAHEKSCYLAGVRTEESPKRLMSLTSNLTYKHLTYGKILNKSHEHYTFYPIYDWSVNDVWKAIHDNAWHYNRVYDEMYRHGVNVIDMRISNLHHETAIQNLLLVQEIEPLTWERIAKRIDGANTIKHLKKNSYHCPKVLPPMFKDWEEYAMYLKDHLVQEETNRTLVDSWTDRYKKYLISDKAVSIFYRTMINSILSSDWDGTKIINLVTRPEFNTLKKYVDGKITPENYEINMRYGAYLPDRAK